MRFSAYTFRSPKAPVPKSSRVGWEVEVRHFCACGQDGENYSTSSSSDEAELPVGGDDHKVEELEALSRSTRGIGSPLNFANQERRSSPTPDHTVVKESDEGMSPNGNHPDSSGAATGQVSVAPLGQAFLIGTPSQANQQFIDPTPTHSQPEQLPLIPENLLHSDQPAMMCIPVLFNHREMIRNPQPGILVLPKIDTFLAGHQIIHRGGMSNPDGHGPNLNIAPAQAQTGSNYTDSNTSSPGTRASLTAHERHLRSPGNHGKMPPVSGAMVKGGIMYGYPQHMGHMTVHQTEGGPRFQPGIPNSYAEGQRQGGRNLHPGQGIQHDNANNAGRLATDEQMLEAVDRKPTEQGNLDQEGSATQSRSSRCVRVALVAGAAALVLCGGWCGLSAGRLDQSEITKSVSVREWIISTAFVWLSLLLSALVTAVGIRIFIWCFSQKVQRVLRKVSRGPEGPADRIIKILAREHRVGFLAPKGRCAVCFALYRDDMKISHSRTECVPEKTDFEVYPLEDGKDLHLLVVRADRNVALWPGDLIISIDGVPVKGLVLAEAVRLIGENESKTMDLKLHHYHKIAGWLMAC